MTRGRGAPSLVRIFAGTWKGRRLEVPPSARPTSGRARAALFDLLGPERVAGARFLDLFAGSGAVGLEASSRGAALAVLVERDGEALGRTLARLRPEAGRVRHLAVDAPAAIAALAKAGERFGVIFSDPPYGQARGGLLAEALELLEPQGVLVLQSDAGAAPAAPEGARLLQSRAYGRNVFHFYGMH